MVLGSAWQGASGGLTVRPETLLHLAKPLDIALRASGSRVSGLKVLHMPPDRSRISRLVRAATGPRSWTLGQWDRARSRRPLRFSRKERSVTLVFHLISSASNCRRSPRGVRSATRSPSKRRYRGEIGQPSQVERFPQNRKSCRRLFQEAQILGNRGRQVYLHVNELVYSHDRRMPDQIGMTNTRPIIQWVLQNGQITQNGDALVG